MTDLQDLPTLGDSLPDGTPVPEKFRGKSPADVLKAYQELERARSQPEPPKPPEGQNPMEIPQPGPGADTSQFAKEIASTGTLSAASRQALKNLRPGTTDAEIDTHIAGIKAIQHQAISAAHQIAGGEEGWASMMQWAQQNLSPDRQRAFNAAANHPDPNVRELAIRGLHAEFTGSGQQAGSSPNLVNARPNTGSPAGPAPFSSVTEYQAALATPDYHKNPAARDEVMARYEASMKAGVAGF